MLRRAGSSPHANDGRDRGAQPAPGAPVIRAQAFPLFALLFGPVCGLPMPASHHKHSIALPGLSVRCWAGGCGTRRARQPQRETSPTPSLCPFPHVSRAELLAALHSTDRCSCEPPRVCLSPGGRDPSATWPPPAVPRVESLPAVAAQHRRTAAAGRHGGRQATQGVRNFAVLHRLSCGGGPLRGCIAPGARDRVA